MKKDIKWFIARSFWGILLLLGSYYSLNAQGKTRIRIVKAKSFSDFTAAIPEAGSDINSIYSTSKALINLSLTTYGSYRISVQKEDTNWDNRLQFYVLRTGAGTGDRGSSINGGTIPVQLGNFQQTFFEGTYSRRNIPIQYEFRNLSVLIPAEGHTSAVIYTITDL